MDTFFEAMTWPLVLCLLLAGLHTYLGTQVLARKVVFADLAMAQMAGLGAVWAVLFGWSVDESPWVVRGFALAFTLVGAAVLAGLRAKELPREAIAASAYAVAGAGTILVGASLHHGLEEVRDLLAGTALFARPETALGTAILFAAVGGALFAFRRKLEVGPRSQPPVPWDFAFFAALGLAVSHSVPLVGVLLVFSYLLLPASTGALLAKTATGRLRVGWAAAALSTVVGLGLSYARDLPPEPTVVLCLGASLGLAAVFRYLAGTHDRLGASLGVLGGVTLAVVLLAWSYEMRAPEQSFDLTSAEAPAGARLALVERVETNPELWDRERATLDALLVDGEAGVRSRLLELIAERGDVTWLDRVHSLLQDPDDLVRERALACVRALGRPESAAPLAAAAATEQDEFLDVELADALLALDDPRGLSILLDVMERGRAEFARREAYRRLEAHEPVELPYDAASPDGQRAEEVAALRRRLVP